MLSVKIFQINTSRCCPQRLLFIVGFTFNHIDNCWFSFNAVFLFSGSYSDDQGGSKTFCNFFWLFMRRRFYLRTEWPQKNYIVDIIFSRRLLNSTSHYGFSKHICIFTKNWHLFDLDIGKVDFCGVMGDIVSPENQGVFELLKEVTLGRILSHSIIVI